MANDFLFELGCEELPSAAVWTLAQAFTENLQKALEKAGVSFKNIKPFATPRRLAVLITDLQAEQPDQRQQRRGPAESQAYDASGKPTPALLGFAKSCGVAVDALSLLKNDKGSWLVYEFTEKGAKTSDLIPKLIEEVLCKLPISKPMRWGDGEVEFARPIHWVLMLYGPEIIPATILGVKAGGLTYGHRFHHPKAIELTNPNDYETLLHEAKVVADFEKRRELIVKQINELAQQVNATAIMPQALVDEVTSIVEWPQALLGQFEQEFLDVPSEALIASMQTHQKSFALENSGGQLLANFITISNIESLNPKQVIAGNEKVIRARLSDAAFFYQLDKKKPLAHYIPETAKVIFQAKLGSLLDKAKRLEALIEYLADFLNLDKKLAKRAAELSKTDLLTGMVGEFPELQGLMGFYYAKNDQENEAVALALKEQYMPRFAADELPSSTLGLALSLSERIDTLVGIFGIGQKPSGVKDPFKLRRNALAVVRLLLISPVPLNLSTLIAQMLAIYGNQLPNNAVLEELKPFILERLQSYYQAEGFSADLIQAVLACQQNYLDDFDQRIRALATFVKLPAAQVLSAACKRVDNLLQQAEQLKLNILGFDENKMIEPAEKALYSQLVSVEKTIATLYEKREYESLLSRLASLREPVDTFFDQVMVMVDDTNLKANRLSLLKQLQTVLQGVADISLLQLNL